MVVICCLYSPRESSRGPKPSRSEIAAGDMCGGRGEIFMQENPIFRKKNFCLAVSAPENPKDFSGNCKAENPKGFQVSPEAKLPTAKSKILTRHRRGGRKAENPKGFQVSPRAKLPTAQIRDLRRGTCRGSLLPRPQIGGIYVHHQGWSGLAGLREESRGF